MHGFARHIETVRSLSRNRQEKDAQLKCRDSRSSSVQRAGRAIAARPLEAAAAGSSHCVAAAAALAAAVSQAARPGIVEDDAAKTPAQDMVEAAEREARQRRSRCNRDIKTQQEREIQKILDRKKVECARQEQQEMKSHWRSLRSKSYLLNNIKDPELKLHVARTSDKPASKPLKLPKLPSTPHSPASKQNGPCVSEELEASKSDVPAAVGSPSPSNASTSSSSHARPLFGNDAAEAKAVELATTLDFGRSAPDGEVRAALPHECMGSIGDEEDASKQDNPEQTEQAAQADEAEEVEVCLQPESNTRQRGSMRAELAASSFLDRQQMSLASRICRTMDEWKRNNRCGPDQKVFACCGGYPDLRDALLRRGWFHNTNKESIHFDLKWGMVTNISHEHLLPNQMVNHFDKARDLTTKNGLTIALRNSAMLNDRSGDFFYPRGFDLYDPLDRADFVLDFKLTKAESILRRFLEHIDAKQETTFSQDVIHVASKICNRLVTEVDDLIDCGEMAEEIGNVSSADWKLLEKANLDNVEEELERKYTKAEMEELIQKKASTTSRTAAALQRAAERIKEEKAKEKKKVPKKKKKEAKEEVPICVAAESYNCPRGQWYIRQARAVIKELEASNQQHTINGGRNAWIIKPSGKSRGRGIQMLRELQEIFHATESDGFQWICQKYIEQPQLVHGYKFDIRQWVLVTDWNPLTVYIWQQPYLRFAGQKYEHSCENRDPYIHLVNNSIIKYMDGFDKINDDLNASGFMWFRQNYEEWLHDNYCKCDDHHTPWLTPPPYTCDTFGVRWEDVKDDVKAHDDDDEAEPDDDEPDEVCAAPPPAAVGDPAVCQPCKPQVAAAEEGHGGSAEGGAEKDAAKSSTSEEAERGAHNIPECANLWTTLIKPQIEEIILTSLRCVSDSVTHRKNTTELFGYDFMLSEGAEQPKVWLIEVNSSPACDYSTPVTCPLVKQMMEDTAKVMVDLRENPDGPTGEWELLQHEHTKPVKFSKNCPVNLEVCGSKVKRPKGWKKKKKKKKSAAKSPEPGEDDAGDLEEEDEGDDDSVVDGGVESDSDS